MVDDELEAKKLVLDGIRDGTVMRAEGMAAQEMRNNMIQEEEQISLPPVGGKPIIAEPNLELQEHMIEVLVIDDKAGDMCCICL